MEGIPATVANEEIRLTGMQSLLTAAILWTPVSATTVSDIKLLDMCARYIILIKHAFGILDVGETETLVVVLYADNDRDVQDLRIEADELNSAGALRDVGSKAINVPSSRPPSRNRTNPISEYFKLFFSHRTSPSQKAKLPRHGGIHAHFDGPVDSIYYQQKLSLDESPPTDHDGSWYMPVPWERGWSRNLALETFIYEQITKHEHIAADAVKQPMNDQAYCHYMKMEHGAARGQGRTSRLDDAVKAFPEDQQALNQEMMLDRFPGQSSTELDSTWGWYRPTVVPKRKMRGFSYYWVDEHGEPLLKNPRQFYKATLPTILEAS
ncbi:MAG: hypothetical protein Q9203_002916 [Teloschistes exilis]